MPADPAPCSADPTLPSPETLQTAPFYRMTRCSLQPCGPPAQLTAQQLGALLEHPHIELLPRQREVLACLAAVWRARLPIQAAAAAAARH